MKKYLFGLGAMLVGAGLMFVFTHTEVSAESETDRCDELRIPSYNVEGKRDAYYDLHLKYCKIRDLTCVDKIGVAPIQLSCVKTKGGLFK